MKLRDKIRESVGRYPRAKCSSVEHSTYNSIYYNARGIVRMSVRNSVGVFVDRSVNDSVRGSVIIELR